MRFFGAILQTLGAESIVLGFLSYIAELSVRHELRGDGEVPPRLLVALANLVRTVTQTSPLIVLTVLGIVLIVMGGVLRLSKTNGYSLPGG